MSSSDASVSITNDQDSQLVTDDDKNFAEHDAVISEYDIISSPNDFNIATAFDLIEKKSIKIPGFQRNYVWDKKRASKLIESLLLGLPIPQIFLFEKSKNNFLVIDGQQRLMTIYYFKKKRFPRGEMRSELTEIYNKENKIPDKILNDDKYFTAFNLRLDNQSDLIDNKYNKLNYDTLEDQDSFNMRTVRFMIIKQISPQDNDSSIYEIFNRLNSGGMNLTSQEIRACLYHSEFFDMLARINANEQWRKMLNKPKADIHQKDIEMLLRCFSILHNKDIYKPSLSRFLNDFAKKAQEFNSDEVKYLENLFLSFMDICSKYPDNLFIHNTQNKFMLFLLDTVFYYSCKMALDSQTKKITEIDSTKIKKLKENTDFSIASQSETSTKKNFDIRFNVAEKILLGDKNE